MPCIDIAVGGVLWKSHGEYCKNFLEYYHSTLILIRLAIAIIVPFDICSSIVYPSIFLFFSLYIWHLLFWYILNLCTFYSIRFIFKLISVKVIPRIICEFQEADGEWTDIFYIIRQTKEFRLVYIKLARKRWTTQNLALNPHRRNNFLQDNLKA